MQKLVKKTLSLKQFLSVIFVFSGPNQIILGYGGQGTVKYSVIIKKYIFYYL